MRRAFGVFAGLALVALIALSGALFLKYQKSSSELAAVKTEDEQTRDRYSDAINSIATIQDSLNSIVLGNDAARLATSAEQESRLSENQGDAVLARIAVLRAGVERSKARIQDLDDHLKKSGIKINGLEKMMANLRKSVVQKEAMIAQLTTQVDSLNTQVAGLTTMTEDQRRELGTVFCMIGDKKQLTASGAVIAKGGVLGLGKTLKATGTVDEAMCTALDTDTQTTLDISAKKAVLLTPQPASSYALEPEGDHTVLHILDPKEFRKVRHVVILTAA